ncbi:neprilysin-21 [Fopius arisanus]|uniref:Neprilysin-21 n=1 Tax=Fopius arisanus TaxID=64838 RepID=A0A0C9R0P0_9HYME|nr:PREDICTED: neprilysin-21-like [Fopius arisanus]
MLTSGDTWMLFAMLTASLVLSSSMLDDTPDDSSEPEESKTCTTDDCKKVAQFYTETMDKTIDPCQDFYKYTCGGWNPDTSIPTGINRLTRLKYMEMLTEQSFKSVLESPPDATDILPMRQAKKFYQSCVNAELSNSIRTIISLFDAIGGWPMIISIDDWKINSRSWQEIDAYFANLSAVHTFFDVTSVTLSPEDPASQMVHLEWPDMDYVPPYIGDYSELQKKIETLHDIFTSYTKAHVSHEQLQKDIRDFYDFVRNFSDIMKRNRDIPPRVMDLTTWIDIWEKSIQSKPDPKTVINWREVIQRNFDVYNIEINDAAQVTVDYSYHLDFLELLRSTDERTIVNFIYWTFLHDTLEEYVVEMMKDPENVGADRSKFCMTATIIDDMKTYWFINEYVADYNRHFENVDRLVTNIQKELQLQINRSDYMSSSFKLDMQNRLDDIIFRIEPPSDWANNRSLFEDFYTEELVFDDDYVINRINYERFSEQHRLVDIKHRLSIGWIINSTAVNAYYDHDENGIYILSGITQLPSFSLAVPEYINYGGLGMIVAHEIGHALDPEGIGEMTLQSFHLSDILTREKYRRQLECISDLFRKFYDSETISLKRIENVADAFGMSLVLSVYKRLKQNGEINVALTIPGFEEFTDEQMFFINFAQLHCEITTPNYTVNHKHPYSLPKLRVNIGVSNSPGFATAFSCAVGSPMNPVKRCSIWKDEP